MRWGEVLWAVVITTIEAIIFSFFKKRNGNCLTSFLTALFITVVRAVILSIASPWQANAAPVPTAELVGRAHGSGCAVNRRAKFSRRFILKSLDLIWVVFSLSKQGHQTCPPQHDWVVIRGKKHLLTAVLLVWLVIAVELSVTPPAGIDAHSAAAHEFDWSAGLVGSCIHGITSEICHSGQKCS